MQKLEGNTIEDVETGIHEDDESDIESTRSQYDEDEEDMDQGMDSGNHPR